MNDLLLAKNTAYLIDKAIILNPAEVMKSLGDSPAFAKGTSIKKHSLIDASQLKFLCKFFWNDHFEKPIIEGFRGTGVRKINEDEYEIVIYGNQQTCGILKSKLPFIQNVCKSKDIVCDEIGETSFACNNHFLQGGIRLKSQNGNGSGILGGWLKRQPSVSERRKFVGVTNSHVADILINSQIGNREIYTDNNIMAGEIEKNISLKPFIPTSKNTTNLADIALIRPGKATAIDQTLTCISNKPFNESDADDLLSNNNSNIILCCDHCQYNNIGNITAILVSFYMSNNGQIYKFEDVIQIDKGEIGDSGSLVLDTSENICGLFFAISRNKGNGKKYGYANKWEYVKREAGIKFSY